MKLRNTLKANQAGSSSAISTFGNFTTKSAFGGSPAFGTPAFGKPAFSQASTPAPSISTFGPPIFGQPQSQLADATRQAPAFGQSSQVSSFIKPASQAFGNLTMTGSSNALDPFQFLHPSHHHSPHISPLTTATNLSIHRSSFNEIHGNYYGSHELGQTLIPTISSNIDLPIRRRTHEALPVIGKGRSV